MNCLDATTIGRYVRGEMTEEERDAIEEHYFGCPSCAKRLKKRFEAQQPTLSDQVQ